MNYKTHLRVGTLLICALGLALTSCAQSVEGDTGAVADSLTPTERYEKDAGVVVKPGMASCVFNNELPDYSWDGSGTYEAGTIDDVTVAETPDSYLVTFTGSFFDSATLITEQSRFETSVYLDSEDLSHSATLQAQYDGGELVFAGVSNDDTDTPQTTSATLTLGKFTATYEKSAAELDGWTPELWAAEVYFDEGAPYDVTANTHIAPVSFRCDDGRLWTWKPLA